MPTSAQLWPSYTNVTKVVDFRGRLCRSGVSPDIEWLTLAGETPALHSRSQKAIRFWYNAVGFPTGSSTPTPSETATGCNYEMRATEMIRGKTKSNYRQLTKASRGEWRVFVSVLTEILLQPQLPT